MITLPPFKSFLASNIPSVYDNTLSYYDELTKLIAYLEQQVVPAVNETAGQVDGIKKGLEDLKSYVDHYFDNLDVQEEINNKLDEMAEGGELAGIIAQFLELAPVFAYKTISDLSSADNLSNGCVARVVGNTNAKDGNGAYYLVRTKTGADTPDGKNLVAIGDTLVGERVGGYSDSYIDVKLNGAKGDGTTDDYAVLQDLIDNNPLCTLYFPEGTYMISETLVTPATNSDKVFFKLDENAIIKATSDFTGDFVIDFGGSGTANGFGNSFNKTGIVGGKIDGNGVSGGILVENIHCAILKDLNIVNTVKNGIQIDPSDNSSSDADLNNIYIFGAEDDVEGRTAIVLNGYDNTLTNIRTCGYHVGVEINSGGNILTNIHPLFGYDNSNTYSTTVGFKINGNDNIFDKCYSDNFSTAFYFVGEKSNQFSNIYIMFFSSGVSDQHIAFRCTTEALVSKMTNVKITYPDTGINRGIVIDGGTYPSIYYIGDYMGLRIENLNIQWNKLTYKLSDPILINKISGNDKQIFGGMSDGNALNYWYPLAVFHDIQNAQQFIVNIGNNIIFDVTIKQPNDSTGSFIDANVIANNSSSIKLAIGQITSGELDNVYALYFSITNRGTGSTNNWSRTTQVISEALGTRMMRIPRNGIYAYPDFNGVASLSSLIAEYTLVA